MSMETKNRPTPAVGQAAGHETKTPLLKNMAFGQAVDLAGLAAARPGQVVSRTLAQNDAVSVTLFAFGAGEEIGAHVSNGDALLNVLEGRARVTVGGQAHTLTAGQSIAMPAGVPHAVSAETDFKMLLIVVFP